MNFNEVQLLSFTLGEDIYGIDITRVQEIRALGEIRKLPNTPSHCVGVIDFRNAMVPILDLREVFGYPMKAIDAQTVMVVVSVGDTANAILVGIIVDAVSDVIAIDQSEIKSSPSMGGKVDTNFMKGMFKHEDKIVVLLSLESIFESEDMDALKSFVEHEKALA